MANPAHVEILEKEVAVWNEWRHESRYTIPDLSNLDLSSKFGVDLPGIDLSGANLTGADLSRVNLVGANLRHADLPEAHLPKVLLSQAELHFADLRKTYLAGAHLDGASIETQTMANPAHVEILEKEVAVWNEWRHESRYTIPDLSNLDLSSKFGVDLPGIDLSGANLTGADLSRVNLVGANLRR